MSKSKLTNLVISGVGGQGVVLVGLLISSAARRSGYEVANAELHGMSQRGGSVFTTVRYGSSVNSARLDEGNGDILVALELLEAVRYLNYLKPGGIALVNQQRIVPAIDSLKLAPYPVNIDIFMRRRAGIVVFIPGLEIALGLGNAQLSNCVVLGVLSTIIEFPEDAWLEAMSELFTRHDFERNRSAFRRGIAWAQESHAAAKCSA
jgi:indolepyruvate ferredoxin oxidoreductase beta subunit